VFVFQYSDDPHSTFQQNVQTIFDSYNGVGLPHLNIVLKDQFNILHSELQVKLLINELFKIHVVDDVEHMTTIITKCLNSYNIVMEHRGIFTLLCPESTVQYLDKPVCICTNQWANAICWSTLLFPLGLICFPFWAAFHNKQKRRSTIQTFVKMCIEQAKTTRAITCGHQMK
jgi:hypothetical protein